MLELTANKIGLCFKNKAREIHHLEDDGATIKSLGLDSTGTIYIQAGLDKESGLVWYTVDDDLVSFGDSNVDSSDEDVDDDDDDDEDDGEEGEDTDIDSVE